MVSVTAVGGLFVGGAAVTVIVWVALVSDPALSVAVTETLSDVPAVSV